MGIGDSKINNNGLERRQEDEAWLCPGDSHCLHSMSCCCTPSQSESHLQNLNYFRGDISFLLFLALLCPESEQGLSCSGTAVAKLWLNESQKPP